MFGTLLGGLPDPPGSGDGPRDADERVVAALEAQVTAGLEPLTDGRLRTRGPLGPLAGLEGIKAGPDGLRAVAPPRRRDALTVDAWQFAAGHATGLVKQALPGPYTAARRLAPSPADVDGLLGPLTKALRAEIEALADAGCVLIEIEELDAPAIGTDPIERRRFAEAHRALLDGIDGVHLSLAIVGGSADSAGIETILAAPYASLAVDLIDGPDNWRLVARTPGDRGIVCGALSSHEGSDDGPELLVWATAYASSTGGRGRDRVGLATSGSLEHLAWDVAIRKMGRLGEASSIAGSPYEEAMKRLDPRAIDIRSAALGRWDPASRRPKPKRDRGRPGRRPGGR
jgi:methionine synthase II (cobalamin-independent)